jgi:dihydropteroate synthase
MKSILNQIGKKTLIMGVLNVTPNSFSDGGLYLNPDLALERAKAMEFEGADIIDIGGESTHPLSKPINADEELYRVIPVIKRLAKSISIPISIDTSKACVAAAALRAGASIVNDISALQKDPLMASLVAKHACPIILMNNQLNKPSDNNITKSIIENLKNLVQQALAQGIIKENIILDPGFGFGKSFEENLELMQNLNHLTQLEYPILLGTSNKGTLGRILNLDKQEFIEATLATTVIAIMQGVAIIRVHDVKENVRAAKVTDAIYKKY